MTKWLGLLAALTILAAPVIWNIASSLDPAVPVQTARDTGADAPGITALRAEVQALRQDVDQLRAQVDGLDSRTSIGLSVAAARPGTPAARAVPPDNAKTGPLDDGLSESFDQVVLIGARRKANDGLTVASPAFLHNTFRLPRQDLDQTCRSMTNPRLKDLLRTEDVGPIRVSLLAPAVASLRKIFAEVEAFEPELYARLASSGSLCVRLIRGSTASASAHAYGLAVDINVDGTLDNFADGKTQLGLILMADFFNEEGWIWGAGFGREDSMHFEVSREKIEEWRALGLL